MTDSPGDAGTRGGPAVRMIVAFDDDGVRLVSGHRVVMALPPGDDLEVVGDVQGFWVEVRQADDTVLDRRVLADPMRRDAEVFSDDPQQSLRRVPGIRRQGAFTIVVPDHPAADHVVLLVGEIEDASAELGAGAVRARRRELARFPLPPRAAGRAGS